MPALGSVGIGSGVLTSDILDKLKAAEKSTQINPIDKNIEKNSKKTEALDLLKSLTGTLKSSAFAMKDSSLYQKRTVSNTSEDVEVTARDGVAIQDFSIKDVKLAHKNVIQSGSFTSKDSTVASGDGTLNLNIDGTDYKIEYKSDTTYDELKTKINDIAGDKVTASILQTGDDEFSFTITSDETGKDQQIGLVDFDGNLNGELKSDIYKSDVFDKKTDKIASDSGTLTIKTAGGDTTFEYDSDTTLQQLADKINKNENNDPDDPNNADSSKNVYASVVEDKDGKFSLVLTAKNPAEDDDITIEDNSGNLDTKLVSGNDGSAENDSGKVKDIQTSRDASFKYNGISMTRSKNTIDDIQLGLEIKLLKDDADANVSITQDKQPIKDELENFVTSYNAAQKQIDAMTLADMEAKKVGIFNGNNSINGISRSLRKLITERDKESGLALANFGLEIDRTGKLKLNSSDLDDKLKEDPEAVANFFSGKTTVVGDFDKYKDSFVRFAKKEDITFKELEDRIDDGTYDLNDKLFDDEEFTFDDIKDLKNSEVTSYNYKMESTIHKDGIFEKLYGNLKSLNTSGGTILSMSDGLSKEGKQLEENRTKSLLALNSRYDTMTSRFIQYDSMINSLNNQFSALQQQISMAVNGK